MEPATAFIDATEHEFEIRFQYDPDVVAAVRDLPGRRWHTDRRCWTVPHESVRPVRLFAAQFGFEFTDTALRVADAPVPYDRPAIGAVEGRFTIRFPYNADTVARVRAIPSAYWSPKRRVWEIAVDASDDVARFAVDLGATIEPSAVDLLASARDAFDRIEASSAHDADLDIPNLGGTLLPFQRAGVRYVLDSAGGVLIADEPGLGKTVQALATVAARDAFPAVVVCPASLKLNWQREARRWLPGRSIEIISGTTPTTTTADVVVVNYDVLHAHFDTLPEPAAVILDESHYVKNGAALRTKAAVALSDRMGDDAVRLCLSGTPIVNHPAEIVTQLRVLHRLDEFGGVRAFRRRYGSGTNLGELNRRLRASCYVRRRKADVLTELPPKRWSTVVVEGDTAAMRDYRRAEADIVSYLVEQAHTAALDAGATTDEARTIAWRQAARARAAEHLVAITALKRLAARAKLAAVRQWVADFTDTGSKLVAFAYHRDIVETLDVADCSIRGGDTPDDRQSAVDRFQSSNGPNVIACSLKAAGVGLTLTAASDVLFVEQGWTPADMDQAADRCHRIGQTDSVTAWVMVCADTIDETIAELIEAKRVVVDAATDGTDADTDGAGSVLADLVVRLTERGLDR